METPKQTEPRTPVEPNIYELSCDGTTLTYSTSAIDKTPQLSYASGDRSYVFRGEEIRVAPSEIGKLITVTLEASPDLEVQTLTLVLPPINLEGDESPVRTQAVKTVHRTTIGGPHLVKGQVLTYELVQLSGLARAVVL